MFFWPAAPQVVGELRLVACTGSAPKTEFRFRLRNTNRIEQIQVNDKFVKVAGDEYLVQLPALQQRHNAIPLLSALLGPAPRRVSRMLPAHAARSRAVRRCGQNTPPHRAGVPCRFSWRCLPLRRVIRA